MKNILPLPGLILAATPAAAVAALSASPSGQWHALAIFIGGYAACGLLAVVAIDYARGTGRVRRRRQAPPVKRRDVAGDVRGTATWTRHTLTT